MTRFGWLLGCVAALMACSLSGARAQGDTDLGKNWDLRAGFFVPERAASRAAEGDVWVTVGAEKAIYYQERYRGTFSIDYDGSGKIYNIPICLNARGETNRFRYGIGAGVGINHDLVESKLGFSYNVLLGYVLTMGANPIVFDIRYQGLSVGGNSLNGWQFTAGYHF